MITMLMWIVCAYWATVMITAPLIMWLSGMFGGRIHIREDIQISVIPFLNVYIVIVGIYWLLKHPQERKI